MLLSLSSVSPLLLLFIPSLPAPSFPSSLHSPFQILCLAFPSLSLPLLFLSFHLEFIARLTLAPEGGSHWSTAHPSNLNGLDQQGPRCERSISKKVIFIVKSQTRICKISWLEWKFDYFWFFHGAVGFLRPNIWTTKGKGLVAKAAGTPSLRKSSEVIWVFINWWLLQTFPVLFSVCSCPFVGESAQNKADWERLCMKNKKNSMCHICNIDDMRTTLLLVPYSYSLGGRDK